MNVDRKVNEVKIDYRSFSFEERVKLFNGTVKRLGNSLGKEGPILELIGKKITQLYSVSDEEGRSLVREEINRLYDNLGSLERPDVDDAIFKMGNAISSLLFKSAHK